jgi:type VI secretion system protein ImpE
VCLAGRASQVFFIPLNSAELYQAGRLEEALLALQSEIRKQPENAKLRIFLFQLDCLLGRFDKALTQLQVVASLTAESMLLAQIFRPVIASEVFRQEVFAGKRQPLVFGEPTEWLGLLIQATQLIAQGEWAAAAKLRAQAFELAPASAGHINAEPFAWIADADSRLGPVLEAIVEGNYYWVPFFRIQKIELEKPSDVRDLVWMPARFTWTNGGSVPGHIPARYPGTAESADDALRLGRKTDWLPQPGETYLGLGQRVLSTNASEYPLLECRTIELLPPPTNP